MVPSGVPTPAALRSKENAVRAECSEMGFAAFGDKLLGSPEHGSMLIGVTGWLRELCGMPHFSLAVWFAVAFIVCAVVMAWTLTVSGIKTRFRHGGISTVAINLETVHRDVERSSIASFKNIMVFRPAVEIDRLCCYFSDTCGTHIDGYSFISRHMRREEQSRSLFHGRIVGIGSRFLPRDTVKEYAPSYREIFCGRVTRILNRNTKLPHRCLTRLVGHRVSIQRHREKHKRLLGVYHTVSSSPGLLLRFFKLPTGLPSINSSSDESPKSKQAKGCLYPKFQPWVGAFTFLLGCACWFVSLFRLRLNDGGYISVINFLLGLVVAAVGGIYWGISLIG